MALSIFKNNEVYHLKGKLNSATSRSFIIHFDYVLSNTDHLVINIDELSGRDINGVKAFEIISAIALNNFKKLSVRSKTKNEIFSALSNLHVA